MRTSKCFLGQVKSPYCCDSYVLVVFQLDKFRIALLKHGDYLE